MPDRESISKLLTWAAGGPAASPAHVERALPDVPLRLRPLVADVALDGAGRVDRLALDRATVETLERARTAARVAWLVRSRVRAVMSAALVEHGIQAVFLKGTALAEQVYRHPALRPMADIDAWVRTPQLDAVVPALETAGFRVPERYLKGAPPHPGGATVVVEPGFGPVRVYVEVHGLPSSLSKLPESEVDRMWERRVVLESGFAVMAPTDQLLHVCLHETKRAAFASGLSTLVDVTLIVRRFGGEIEWGAFVDRAVEARLVGSMWSVLSLAREIVGAPIPDDVLGRLSVEHPDRLLEAARDQVWSGQPPLRPGLEVLMGGRMPRGWLRTRFVGKHWREAGELGLSGVWRAWATLRAAVRDLRRLVGRYAVLAGQSDVVGPLLRDGAPGARQRARFSRLLERANAEPEPSRVKRVPSKLHPAPPRDPTGGGRTSPGADDPARRPSGPANRGT